MNAIFTIVAKNYLPLAYTLFDSIKKVNPEVDLFIFVSDNKNETELFSSKYIHLYPSDLNLSDAELKELAFKYNITEFCTSIKPYCFEYLVKNKYEKIIYFDPDILVYESLNPIFEYLNTHFLVITPHYCKYEQNYTGIRNEGMILFSGVYNLGFCAIRANGNGLDFINWWKTRLFNYSYADKTDGLHTDQKWIDLVHCIFGEPIKVLKHPGTNAAIWNMHEREIAKIDDKWKIRFLDTDKYDSLIFYHFSSFNYYANEMPNKLYPSYKERFSFMQSLCEEYRKLLIDNELLKFKDINYSFNFFDNGKAISPLHRRIYRRLIELELFNKKHNPFVVNKNSFYSLLNDNKLLFAVDNKIDSQNENNFEGFDKKVRTINWGMSVIKKIIGVEKYFLLIKFFQRYTRFENQFFLIKEFRDKYKFLNENRP